VTSNCSASRQATELHLGHPAVTAFLSGYRLGLVVAGILVCTGGIAAWLALQNVSSNRTVTNESRGRGAGDSLILATE
jgi:hypothetical protein